MKKGRNYNFIVIENYAYANDYEISDLGNNVIGENFLILKNENGEVISFVLTGTTGSEYIYECIYMD